MKGMNCFLLRFARVPAAVAACAALIGVPSDSFGQLTARGIGMGGAYTALARGVHAPDWNPANLGFPDNPKLSLSIVSVGVGIGNNCFNIDTYNRYATDAFWDSREIQDLLDRIPDDGFEGDAAAQVRLLSFSVGRFAFVLGADVGADARLAKNLFQIPLQGTQMNTVYDFSQTRADGAGVGFAKCSYAHPVAVEFAEHAAVGGTFHLFYGGGYANTERVNLAMSLMDYGIDVQGGYKARVAMGKVGWGLDLGAAAMLRKKWTVGLSLENLYSSIPFDKKVRIEEGYIRGDSLDVLDTKDIEKDDKNSPLQDSTWTVKDKPFNVRLPVVLRVGGAYQDGATVITYDYVQGFSEGAWASTRPRVSFGTEWRGLGWLPLRMGVIFGGRIGFGTSMGLGLRLGGFAMDFGFMSRGFFIPSTSKGLAVALEMGVGL